MSDVSLNTPALPLLHGGWLRSLARVGNPPSEPEARCADCVMCAGVERSGTRVTFRADVKCCSYVPHLTNFLTGRALTGPGGSSVRERIARRAGVTPLGLGLSHDDVRRLVGAQAHFGRAPVVRCPHFVEESQGCGIWEARNAVCSTWFCRHERGAVGQGFWQAVRDLLMGAEERVADLCLRRGDLPGEQVDAVVAHRAAMRETVRRANAGETPARGDSDDDESPGWYERMWGDWQGREEAWFTRCAETAATVDGPALAAALDDLDDARHLVEDVERRWAELQDRRVPQRLRFAPGQDSEATHDVLRLIGYSPFDPMILPADLEPSLWRLDGRPVAQVLAEIEQAHGVGLAPELLGRLHDMRLAVAVSGPDDAPDRLLDLDATADATTDVTADATAEDAAGTGVRLSEA